jgi:SAM-dependent methyltransferase
VWNVNAAAWDEAQGQAGNAFQRELVFPAAEQLLDIPARHYEKASLPRLALQACQLLAESALGRHDCHVWRQVLEIGCGNGSFARRLSASGAVDHVLATDFSQEQLRRARHQTPAHEHPRLRFAALDATRRSGVLALHAVLLAGPALLKSLFQPYQEYSCVLHADLEACGEDAFDAAVLNMVVMDMPDISALASGLRHVLKVSALALGLDSIVDTL